MNKKEQEQWRDSMVETLYPEIKERFHKEIKAEIARLVALHVGKWMDLPLTVKQVANLLDEKVATIYKWQERGAITFDKTGKKKYTISLRKMNIQLSGRKDPALELSGNKTSKVESGDSAGEAIYE